MIAYFATFVDKNEDFKRLLLHTEIRWLSEGKCLRRFYDLYDPVVDFFKDEIEVKTFFLEVTMILGEK